MKKVFLAVLIFLILLIGFLVAAPFIFKDKIIAAVNEEISKNVDAEVSFSDIDISLLSSFPDVSIEIENFKISGKDTFENVVLAHVEQMLLDLDVISVINAEHYKINHIKINKPNIFLKTLKDGTSNTDIFTQSTSSTQETESSSFALQLTKYEILNAYFKIEDAQTHTNIHVNNLTHTGKADVLSSGEELLMHTNTTIDSLYTNYEGISYLNWVALEAKCDVHCDSKNEIYTFKDNQIALNTFKLFIDGGIKTINQDDLQLDLNILSKESSIKELFSLVPAVYKHDFNGLESKGTFTFDAHINGILNEEKTPGFVLNLTINDALIKYPDLPSDIHDFNLDMHVKNPSGDPDHTVVDVNTFSALIDQNQLQGNWHTKTPISNPYVKADLVGKIDFTSLQKIIPLEENEKIQGLMDADLHLNGHISDIENENYEQFIAEGFLELSDFVYQNNNQGPYQIAHTRLEFSPQALHLKDFDFKTKNTDISATGELHNYLAYYLREDPLKGKLTTSSNLINLNDFSSSEETTEASADTLYEVLEIPGNIDFELTSTAQKVIYENKTLENVSSKLQIKDHQLDFKDLSANLLGGHLEMKGVYHTKDISKPYYELDMRIQKFDVQQTTSTFDFINSMAPVVKRASGAYSKTMKLQGFLDTQMEPDLSTLSGEGRINTHQMIVENLPALSTLANKFGLDKYKQLDLNNINVFYKIVNGAIEVSPFDCKIADAKANVSGKCSLEQDLDFKIQTILPASKLGGMAGGLSALLGSKASALIPNEIKANILITGKTDDPKIKLDFSEIFSDQKSMINQQVDQVKEQFKAGVDQGVDKAKEQAREKAEQLIKQAELQASRIRSEAKNVANSIRSKANAEAAKLEQSAKNPLAKIAAKKAADKIRNQANKKANRIESEADQKANSLIQKAKDQAARLN